MKNALADVIVPPVDIPNRLPERFHRPNNTPGAIKEPRRPLDEALSTEFRVNLRRGTAYVLAGDDIVNIEEFNVARLDAQFSQDRP